MSVFKIRWGVYQQSGAVLFLIVGFTARVGDVVCMLQTHKLARGLGYYVLQCMPAVHNILC